MKITYIKTIGFRKFENEFETELFDIMQKEKPIFYMLLFGFF